LPIRSRRSSFPFSAAANTITAAEGSSAGASLESGFPHGKPLFFFSGRQILPPGLGKIFLFPAKTSRQFPRLMVSAGFALSAQPTSKFG
jgi:hypothetical protein